ncbi:MAG TPA: RraA family protein [Sedimentisphaerales bacterium]|jgi:regulator of RNase E activity RraA|nr:RraA family protein [Sedimentisphaerales bacterium]HNU30650.1 RraA family protein [Sedimentisphaerales bacterium]
MARPNRTTAQAISVIVASALVGIAAVGAIATSLPAAQQTTRPDPDELRAGRGFIETKTYSHQEDLDVLQLFDGLRVADVSDGMDKIGLANVGLMSPEIHAAWKDTKHYKHRFIGIAVTVRYVPTNQPPAGPMETTAFDAWVARTYREMTPEPFVPLIRQGTVVVFDDAPDSDVGSIGSNNIMGWKLRGCVGVVTDATARDTDEIATEQMPLYFRTVGRGIRPGRNQIESVNRPIECGGVLVRPGDVIVADGDGVIVVPREKAREVAEYAQATMKGDKAGRRNLYKQLGLPEDDSVK